jgi:hypothetical protein
MKKILFIAVALLTTTFFSCEKETEEISRITYYVDLELKGAEDMAVAVGGTFTDPGFTALENGADVASSVTVDGTVDTSTTGLYVLTYTALNKDGFEKVVHRNVFVVPTGLANVDVSGTYTGMTSNGGPYASATSISKLADGFFVANDFFGGWYTMGRAIGSAYVLKTYFVINADNTITAINTNSPWGPWGVAGGAYNPTTGEISHAVVHSSGYSFDVALIKE